jgi:hypothetical protein
LYPFAEKEVFDFGVFPSESAVGVGFTGFLIEKTFFIIDLSWA